MSLEKIKAINHADLESENTLRNKTNIRAKNYINVLESLKGAKILAGVKYDLNDGTYDQSCFCDTCDCICNQPCHGEGPCYKL